VRVLGVRRVEPAFPQGVEEIVRFAFGNRSKCDDRKRGIPPSAIEAQPLAVGEDAVLRPEVVHVAEQLRFVR
jgi:hypothetical protein